MSLTEKPMRWRVPGDIRWAKWRIGEAGAAPSAGLIGRVKRTPREIYGGGGFMGAEKSDHEWFGRNAETIVDNGYSVVPVRPGTKEPRWPKWQTGCFKDTDLQFLTWQVSNFPADSIGLACGTKIIAIDIDETDPEKAEQLHQIAREELGDTPLIRIGEFPKRLLVYRAPERIDTVRSGKIEVLGCGSKFVAFGIHPVTGKPYYWPENNPTDTNLQSLPAVDRRGIQRFLQRVWPARQGDMHLATVPANDNDPGSRPRKPALTKAERAGLEAGIVRDASNRVVDGREKYLTLLIYEEYQKGVASAQAIARDAWMRFATTADLARPKGSSRRSHYSHRDAMAKARFIIRKAPQLRRAVRGHHPARYLHSFRRPQYWTDDRKRLHHTEAARLGLSASRLVVNRAMLDAVSHESGQCEATVGKLQVATGLSISAIKSARADLIEKGLWIAQRGVYVAYAFDITTDNPSVSMAEAMSTPANNNMPGSVAC